MIDEDGPEGHRNDKARSQTAAGLRCDGGAWLMHCRICQLNGPLCPVCRLLEFRLKNKIYTELGISPKKRNFDLWIWE